MKLFKHDAVTLTHSNRERTVRGMCVFLLFPLPVALLVCYPPPLYLFTLSALITPSWGREKMACPLPWLVLVFFPPTISVMTLHHRLSSPTLPSLPSSLHHYPLISRISEPFLHISNSLLFPSVVSQSLHPSLCSNYCGKSAVPVFRRQVVSAKNGDEAD